MIRSIAPIRLPATVPLIVLPDDGTAVVMPARRQVPQRRIRAMPKGSIYASDLLKLVFQGTPIPGLADNAAIDPATEAVIALHKSDPGIDGLQTDNEADYAGYVRIAVPRSAGGWNVSGQAVSPVDNIDFATMTGGTTQTLSHFSVGFQPTTEPNKIHYVGEISPPIDMTLGYFPRLTMASSITEL